LFQPKKTADAVQAAKEEDDIAKGKPTKKLSLVTEVLKRW